MKPHLVKMLEDGGNHARTLTVAKESGRIALKQQNIDVVKRATEAVSKYGSRVSLVIKADIRPGYAGEITGKVERLEKAIAGGE